MDKLSRSFSDRMRRNSFAGASTELDYDELEHFLLQISSLAEDRELCTLSRERFGGLAARCHAQGVDSGNHHAEELNEVVNMFGAILSSTPNLPARSVAQVHSFVGMIRGKQGRHDCAVQSFLKALWLQASAEDASALEVAITENRLGLAYGKSGNLPQAIGLLEKSIEGYEKAKMKGEHFCVVGAQSALMDFRCRHLQQTLLNQQTKYSKHYHFRRLSHIQEDRELQGEHYQSARRFSIW